MTRDKTNLSPITEGNCPKCDVRLKFDEKDRTQGSEVLCPECKETFNINDAKKTKVNTLEDQKGKTRKITIIIIGVILGYFLIGWICCSTINEEDTREKDYMINGEEKIQTEKDQPQKVEKTQIEEEEEEIKAPTPAPEPKSAPEPEVVPVTKPAPETESKPKERVEEEPIKKENDTTEGEVNALKRALDYLNYTSFSYSGLVKQLEYEKYTNKEAIYAANNCGADWNKQAALKAKEYLNYSSFSRKGLVSQLEYEGFTQQQAEYAANNCGADWNKQAALKAQEYLDYSSFSREGLIAQLEYEGFTRQQAEYGAQAVGY